MVASLCGSDGNSEPFLGTKERPGLPRFCKDPAYLKAYNALEDEFSLAAAMIQARACRPHARTTRRAHAHDAGGDRTARKRPGEAVDAHARTTRSRNRHAAADFVRADAGQVNGEGTCDEQTA
jgi:hypothetical protein